MTIGNFKLTIDGTDIINDKAISITNNRPENNVSVLSFVIDDYQSRNYVDLLDEWTTVELSLKYKGSSYTKTFRGQVDTLKPLLTRQGELLSVTCWGQGRALLDTHCNTSFGSESHNPILNTAREIIQHMVDDYVEESFDGSDTLWYLDSTGTYVENVHAGCSVTSLASPYHNNLTMLNRLCDIVNAWAQTQSPAEPSIHWFVDTTAYSLGVSKPRLYVKELDADHGTGNWDRYYGGSQASATVTQGADFLEYSFDRNLKDYANKVILASAFRKPATDIWTENGGPAWGESGTDIVEYTVTNKLVGSHCLHASPDDSADTYKFIYYPSSHDAGWDFTKVGSANEPPVLSFYVRCNNAAQFAAWNVMLVTEAATLFGDANEKNSYARYVEMIFCEADKWVHIEVPIGPYYSLSDKRQLDGTAQFEWKIPAWGGSGVDWSNVNAIMFHLGTLDAADWYFDDLHFAGKIIREAYDAGEITATKKERQVLIRLDTALDDTLDSAVTGGDYSGTAARLATAELYRRTQIGVATAANRFLTGTLTMPMKEDLLPGQLLHVHAGKKSDGSYRFDLDMRIKELTHNVTVDGGYLTSVNLTADTVNSHAPGVVTQWGILMDHAGALSHAEARDLKSAGVDIDVPRLSFDPTV